MLKGWKRYDSAGRVAASEVYEPPSSGPIEAPKTAAILLPILGLGQEVAWRARRGWQKEGL